VTRAQEWLSSLQEGRVTHESTDSAAASKLEQMREQAGFGDVELLMAKAQAASDKKDYAKAVKLGELALSMVENKVRMCFVIVM